MGLIETQGRRWVLPAVFVVSGAGLVFEITLTRLFSLFFQYHFTFLAVSLAVLGLSLGAASAHALKPAHARSTRTLAGVLAAISLSLSAAAMVIAWLPSAESIFPRALAALVPFFLIGLFTALAFENFSAGSGHLYAADLIGAALGVIAVIVLLNLWSAFSMTLFLAALVGAVAVAFARRERGRSLTLSAASLGFGALLLVVNLVSGAVDFNPQALTGAPRDKTMIAILQDPAQDARIDYTAWSPFARVDVLETNDPNARYVFTDGGAGSFMLRFDGDVQALSAHRNTVEYLPFLSGSPESTLIVGAGGGKDIALALLADADAITAVEINPAVIDATRRFADYNGGILDLPQVDLIEGDARSFVERSDDQFDLIYLNLVYTQAVEPASQTLVENYIFTREAFEAYLDRLAPGGRLAIISHNALEASRAAVTALQAFEDTGTPPSQALDHLWLWMMPAGDATIRTSVLLVGKDPLPAETVEALNRAALSRGMQPLFAPGGYETLFEPLRNGGTMASFIQADADYNLSPTTDDSPYFFNLDHGIPPAIRSTLALAAVLAVGLLALGFFSGGTGRGGGRIPRAMLVYAVLIGLGFMLVEIPLIQRFQLLLGHPILSLAAVLATLLLAGGLGSWISQRWQTSILSWRVGLVGLLIVGLAIVYWFALPPLVDAQLVAPFAVRLLTAVMLTALIGFPMGIPFPSLLRLTEQNRGQVALLWAINGAFSVLGSTLAVIISLQWGFGWALLAGAAMYLLLAVVAVNFVRGKTPALVRQVEG